MDLFDSAGVRETVTLEPTRMRIPQGKTHPEPRASV